MSLDDGRDIARHVDTTVDAARLVARATNARQSRRGAAIVREWMDAERRFVPPNIAV